MANSPDDNILPQEASTPLKKNVKCNAFSTPKTNAASVDCQQMVADFKLFLDELGIDDSVDKLDDATDCTLEDELSKLETTLNNIDLEYSIQECVHDVEEVVKYSDCGEHLTGSNVVMQNVGSIVDIVTQNECGDILVKIFKNTLMKDVSDDNSIKKIQEHESREVVMYPNCKDELNDSKLVSPVSLKSSSEANYVTVDESGEISVEKYTDISDKNVSFNSNNPVKEIQPSKHESDEDVEHSDCKEELNGSKLVIPVSSKISTDADVVIVYESGGNSRTVSNNILGDDLNNEENSVLCIFDSRDTLQQNDAAILNKKNFPGMSCIVNHMKDPDILHTGNQVLGVKPEMEGTNTRISEQEITSVNINSVANSIGTVCLKEDILSKEADNEICIVSEIKAASLQTNNGCLNMAKVDSDSQSSTFEIETTVDMVEVTQLPGEEIKSPLKCLNDINKENEIFCHSATVTSKLSNQVDADLNKENILDKHQVDKMPAADNESGIKKDIVRVAEEFISQDPEENKDNNNEKWEELRKLTTNPERYRALRKRWQNISNPDPNKNLTTRRCFKKNFIRKKLTAKLVPKKFRKSEEINSDNADNELIRKLRKRKCPGDLCDEPDTKKAKTYPCTILYDEQIAFVTKAMHQELSSVNVAEEQALTKLNFLQTLEQEKLKYREGCYYNLTPNAEQLRNRQDTETLVALGHFQKEKKRIEDARHAELSKLQAAADEIYAFHSFYNGITEDNVNTLLLTEEQVLHLRDIEDYYDKINTIYKNCSV